MKTLANRERFPSGSGLTAFPDSEVTERDSVCLFA